jgi:hypothetical protein
VPAAFRKLDAVAVLTGPSLFISSPAARLCAGPVSSQTEEAFHDVWPTEAGRAAKAGAIGILDEQQRCFLAPLTAAERQQLGALLKRLRH